MAHEKDGALPACARFETRLKETAAHVNRSVCVLVGWEGPITLWADGRRFVSDALLVRPGVEHRLAFGDQATSVIYLDQALWPASDRSPARTLRSAERDLAQQAAPEAPFAVDELIAALRLESLKLFDIEAVLREIAAEPMTRMSQDALARRLGCERSNALRKFKARTGLTFRRYKQWRAVRAATHALLSGDTIGDAALDAGFADAAHFSRAFKSTFGVSPSQARCADTTLAPNSA